MTEYHKQILKISDDWRIIKNEFYDIDPLDDVSEDDKFNNIYCEEDMLYIQKGQFHLDLGWYGSDFKKQTTGYNLVLFRGENWENCELLELIRSKSKSAISIAINEFIELVNEDFYHDKTGYKIDENNAEYRYIGQHSQFSVSRNLKELKE